MAVTRSILRSRLGGIAAAITTLLATSITVLNGWRPLSRRGGRRSIPLFLNGLVASEAPLPLATLLVMITGRLVRRTRGFTRLSIAALGTAGLAASLEQYRRARRTAAELPATVRDELGGPISTSVGGVTPRTNRAPWPLLHRSYTSRATRGISYGPHGAHNILDVWRRPDVPGHTPVLVQIHGGGWSIGDNRTQGVPLMSHMAEAGWTCVAPRYRLSPRATWPEHLDDIRASLTWVRENIERYGGDPSFIALTGGSAGGHLAALAGLTSEPPVQAVVPFYGIYDWIDADHENNPAVHHLLERHVVKSRVEHTPDVFRSASPIEHVSENAPPFFVLHGTNDTLLHVEPARRFVERLRAVSRRPVLYSELPLGQHAFDLFRTPRSRGACEAVNGFLSTLASHQVCQRSPSSQ
jgi:acetyl esterase/lipase